MIDVLLKPENLIALATLTLLEIVLGIDNVVFISILVGKLPREKQGFARQLGLGLALILRLGLLFAISWIVRLTNPLFTVIGHAFSGRDLILLGGGLFLIGKSTHEIYDKLEVEHADSPEQKAAQSASLGPIIAQILVLDIVFSLDSVITAVGMAREFILMAIAVVLAVVFMLIFAGKISDFVNRHPSMKVLALSFLLLIGVMLVGEGMGRHIPKGYIYFSMAFSLGVEVVNMRLRKKNHAPVPLHNAFEGVTGAGVLPGTGRPASAGASGGGAGGS